MDFEKLLSLDPADFLDRDVPVEEMLSWFEVCDASWLHSGNPEDPHAELTSGMCSNGFFNCLRVLKYVNLSEILAIQMARRIRAKIGNQPIDWVIGSPMAGITFGLDVARALDALKFMFTEKDPDHKGGMLWQREVILEGESVLQIEELITTAGTLNAVQGAIDAQNPNPVDWIPIIASLVHRPPKLPVTRYGNRKVVSLIETEVWAITPGDCPLCEGGSVRYRPKTHWAELTGKA